MVRRADDHGIDVLALQQLTEVLVDVRLAAVFLLHVGGVRRDMAFVHVAERRDLDTRLAHERAHVRGAHTAAADQTEDDLLVGGDRLLRRHGPRRQPAGRYPQPCRCAQEAASRQLGFACHRFSPQFLR